MVLKLIFRSCGINGSINFMTFQKLSKIVLKLAALAKSAPRRHGNIVFEFLAPWIPEIFSGFSDQLTSVFSLNLRIDLGRHFGSF